MNDQEILGKIESCFKNVFTEEFSFSPELSRTNFVHWDSLHHINLLVELERNFGVRFDGASATVMTSVENIVEELKQKLA